MIDVEQFLFQNGLPGKNIFLSEQAVFNPQDFKSIIHVKNIRAIINRYAVSSF